MDSFERLSEEKRKVIINAALSSFGTNGYRKASVGDIASAAGISKSMVFHYFGTKKALYLYLIGLCGKMLADEIDKSFDNSVTDFFDRVRMATDIQFAVAKDHPPILAFMSGIYFEADSEVRPEIEAFLSNGEALLQQITLDGIDVSRLKKNVDPRLVLRMLTRLGEGYVGQLPVRSEINVDDLVDELHACMDLLKNNLYKE